MQFENLDALRSDIPAHVLAWRFTDESGDDWTRRLNSFKAQQLPALKGAARVLESALPRLMAHNGWVASQTALTVALSSSDTQCVSTKPLARVGRYLAPKLGVQWLPSILTKNAHRQLHTIFNAGDRDAEIAKADYRCASISGVRRIVVLDDLITRGGTLNNIVKAILKTNREMLISPIALGKTERKSYAASLGKVITNERVPAAWTTLWDTT